MNPLRWLIHAFVNTFGITPPTAEKEKRYGAVIAAMLGGVAVILVMIAWLVHSALTR